MPRIYVLSGPDLGRTWDVGDGATFGRTADCAVTLRDASVSRAHARLEASGTGWRIVDAGSRNGVFRGTERVPAAELADGDEFRLGEVLLRFRTEVVAMPQPATAPQTAAPSTPSVPDADVAAGPALQFTSRGASRAEPDPLAEEIELEGDWSAAVPPSAPSPSPSAGAGAGAGAGASSAPGAPDAARDPGREPALSAARSAPAPVAAPRSAANDARARKLAAAGIASGARASERDGRGVLQFHRVAQADGVLRQDLAQQPAWLRATVIVLALAGAVALAWFGYQAATAAKARIAPADASTGGDAH